MKDNLDIEIEKKLRRIDSMNDWLKWLGPAIIILSIIGAIIK